MARFAHVISAVDTHTAGEPTRIVLSGLPPIEGSTMADKKRHMKEHLDRFRTLLMHEPRGHRDMFGAVLTPPIGEHCQYGVLFMDSGVYLDMCGHGVMGVTAALLELGIIPPMEPETVVAFDTPAGSVSGRARIEGGRVIEVSVAGVPCFVYARQVAITLPEVGEVAVDVSFGGNFFALVRAKDLEVSIHAGESPRLVRLGIMIRDAINDVLKVQHPTEPHIDRVELTEIYDQPDPATPFSRSVVIFGRGQMDRCPCGTGTSAAMALLHDRGELPLGVELVDEGILGTRFRGRLVRAVRVGSFGAAEPIVTGSAYITGIQQFVVDPSDPLKDGFLMQR